MTVQDDKTGEDVTLTGATKFRARTFVVFNASQVNGYTPKEEPGDAPDPIDTAEQFFAGVGADVEHRSGGRAYYSPDRALIVLPPCIRSPTRPRTTPPARRISALDWPRAPPRPGSLGPFRR